MSTTISSFEQAGSDRVERQKLRIRPITKSSWTSRRWAHAKAWFQRTIIEGIVLKRQAERLYLVFGGHIFFQTLNAAARLDLFTLLKKNGGLTRAEITSHLGIADQPARILLLGLVSS